MRKVRCSAGHYYDADKHQSCPFCGMMASEGDSIKTQALDGGVNSEINTDIENIQQRMSVGGGFGGNMGGMQGQMGMGTQPLEGGMQASKSSSSSTVAIDSHAKEMKQTGATVAIDSIKVDDSVIVPVVGWLACVNGLAKGKSYELFASGNKIGRNNNYNINLKEDISVSKEVCAEIVYDNEEKMFFITPGTTNGKARKNGKIVLQPEVLDNFDRIKIGKSEMIFVALCGKNFEWEKKDEK